MTQLTGQCLCGAVTMTVQNVPATFNACHCDMCRRWTGSRFLSVYVAQADVTLTGRDTITIANTSDWAERAFCNACGTPLWYHIKGSDHLGLSAGLLDNPTDLTLKREYYVDKMSCIHALPDTRIQMTEAEAIAMFAPPQEGEPS